MLEVAGRLFATRGYSATSMDEIATGAKTSKPMLYAYFGSKHGLYLAYMRQTAERLFERLLTAAPADTPAEQRLLLGLDAFFAFVDERRDGWSVLFQQAAAHDAPLAGEVAARRQRLALIATRLLAEAAAARASAPPKEELEALGQALVGAAESLANWWLQHPEVPRATVVSALIGLTRLELPAIASVPVAS